MLYWNTTAPADPGWVKYAPHVQMLYWNCDFLLMTQSLDSSTCTNVVLKFGCLTKVLPLAVRSTCTNVVLK